MEMTSRTQIIDSLKIERMIRRLAHQVLEDHYREEGVAIVGVSGMGAEVARLLEEEFAAISDLAFDCFEIGLNKVDPLKGDIRFTGTLDELRGRAVLLVDDVLNSGRTLSFAMAHLLGADPASLRTVVLVDRIHRTFPIRADYYGMRLSTNLKEHVAVVVESAGLVAYLD